MASQEQLRELTGMVLEALRYRRRGGGNDNPALGQAIRHVDAILLPWARAEAAGEFDVENIVADAGLEMFSAFVTFDGTTGGEFFGYTKKIVARGIARMRRLSEAKEQGCLRRAVSLEGNAEAARLAERLASHEPSPDAAAMIRENRERLRRAMRGLSVDQLRVVRLHGSEDRPFEEIGAKFGRSASWAYDVWDAAAAQIRTRLMRPRRVRRRRQTAMAR
jgi:RNA polymerase sigma factor (sigma-70 family)